MTLLDSGIVIAWLVIVFAVGIAAGFRARPESFWLNDRRTPLPLLITTIVATQVGGGTVLGIASSTYESGIGFGAVAVLSTLSGFLAVALLAPRAKRMADSAKAVTITELLGLHYSRRTELAASAIIIFAYFSLVGGQLIAAAAILKLWSGWGSGIALAIAAIGLVTYTAFAGLRGDIATDALHFCIMAVVLIGVLGASIIRNVDIPQVLGAVPPDVWNPVRFGGWVYLIVGMLLGALVPLVSVEMWLRVFASSSERAARRSYVVAAIVVLPFYLIPLLMGALGTQLFGPIDPQSVFGEYIRRYLGDGTRGLAIAALLAVIISTANTYVVVLSATLYRNIWSRRGEVSSELRLSRFLTFVVGLLAFAYALIVPDLIQLLLNAFFVIAVLAPALLAMIYARKVPEPAAFWSIAVGGAVTVAALPFMPKEAFVPGLGLCLMTFGAMTWLARTRSTG